MFMILNSIYKNIGILKTHLIVFLLKSLAFFACLFPLKLLMDMFFSEKTISEDLLEYSDLNAFHEFFRVLVSPDMAWYGFPQSLTMILCGIVVVFFVLFLFIDGFIDAGMLSAIEQSGNRYFFKGMWAHGFSFFKLRLWSIIPYMTVLCIILVPAIYFYIAENYLASILVLLFLVTPLMFLLKAFDHAKYLIRREGKKAKSAFLISFTSIFQKTNKTFILNIQVFLLFLAGYFIYGFLDNILLVDSTGKIWIMLLLQQLTLFGKQILRYSFMTAVGDLTR